MVFHRKHIIPLEIIGLPFLTGIVKDFLKDVLKDFLKESVKNYVGFVKDFLKELVKDSLRIRVRNGKPSISKGIICFL